MKKIIYILLMAVVATCFFISCNKENNLDISKKNESHAKCAISNPYDIYGELHNLAMEEARKKDFFEDMSEIVDFSVCFTASHIEKIHPFYTVEEWISTFRDCANFFSQEDFLFIMSEQEINFHQEVFRPLELTSFQETQLQRLFNHIQYEEDAESLLSFISGFEYEILNDKNIGDDEKRIVLLTTSIAKHSCVFSISLFSGEQKPGWYQRIGKKVVKADAIGAVCGIADAVLTGKVAAGAAAGGVAGAIGVVLGTATVDGIIASVAGAAEAVATETSN